MSNHTPTTEQVRAEAYADAATYLNTQADYHSDQRNYEAAEALRAAAQDIPAAYQHGDSPSAWLTRRANELEDQP